LNCCPAKRPSFTKLRQSALKCIRVREYHQTALQIDQGGARIIFTKVEKQALFRDSEPSTMAEVIGFTMSAVRFQTGSG
jgi:hypothetical protein